MEMHHHHSMIPQVTNMAHQHAFILVGEAQLFGVHMTQYHTELHKYQVIIKLHLPDDIYKQYLELRRQNPQDTFILCNAKDLPGDSEGTTREFSIPQLGSGIVQKFVGNIFQGIRPFTPEEEAADSHFFPWSKKYVRPVLAEFEATVERIVTYRPFDHVHQLPEYATYLLFGDSKSGEAHMTNLQTARLITDAFTPPVFGPDYDHVMSLATRPDWLVDDAALLEAGVVVTTPQVCLLDPGTGVPTIPATAPFAPGSQIEVLYRGVGPTYSVTAGQTYLYATAVCNSAQFFAPAPANNSYLHTLPKVAEVLEFSTMPSSFWAFPSD
jgi:hypothetical protein